MCTFSLLMTQPYHEVITSSRAAAAHTLGFDIILEGFLAGVLIAKSSSTTVLELPNVFFFSVKNLKFLNEDFLELAVVLGQLIKDLLAPQTTIVLDAGIGRKSNFAVPKNRRKNLTGKQI